MCVRAQAPCRIWRLRSDPNAAIVEHQAVMRWIDQLLDARAELFYPQEGGQDHLPLHQTSLLQEGSFFRLILSPDPDMLDHGQPLHGVTLVFSLLDLYLLGFLHSNVWYLYDDARVEGSGHSEEGNHHYWKEPWF